MQLSLGLGTRVPETVSLLPLAGKSIPFPLECYWQFQNSARGRPAIQEVPRNTTTTFFSSDDMGGM